MSVPLGVFAQLPPSSATRPRKANRTSTTSSIPSACGSTTRADSLQTSPSPKRNSVFDLAPRAKSFSDILSHPRRLWDRKAESRSSISTTQSIAVRSTSSSISSVSPVTPPKFKTAQSPSRLRDSREHQDPPSLGSASILAILPPSNTKLGRSDEHAGLSAPSLPPSPGSLRSHSPHDTPLQSYRPPKVPQSMSRPTAASSRSSTLDSSISVPSPNQLATNLSSVNSSSTSLVNQGIQEAGALEDELKHSAPRSDSTAHPAQIRAASPPPPLPSQPQPTTSASSSSHLSGLVCNVHRTTGREPHALVGASTTILGDKLYVFGGRRISRSRPTLTSDIYELNLLRRHWTKIEAKGDVPPPRYFHSVCALGDTKLVCYGGMSPEPTPQAGGESTEGQVTVMSDVHIYDVPSQTWMKVNTPDTPQGRYAHCAAILPSSAVFASANAPLSAIHHNPAGRQPNQGSIGMSLDGTGGAEMIVVGGQDSGNSYIEQISIFNLRSLKWTSTSPTTGRSCGAYRSVVTPLTTMKASEIGAGAAKGHSADDLDDPSQSGSPMLVYTNYNFLDVKLELQVRQVDGTLVDKPMQAAVSPPGLRFPSGGIIDNHFVVAGTFLTSSKQEFALWALDLRTLTWAKIDVASSIFSSGSWNRGVLWNRRNAFVILGNRKRNLVDDYNNRRLNFSNICLVQLEAFGLYDNPRKVTPLSDFTSISAPTEGQKSDDLYRGGCALEPPAASLGEMAMNLRELADMEVLTLDGTRIPVSSRFIARRWGSTFNVLMQDANPALAGTDTMTLRPSAASIISRNSSVTITPSFNTTSSGAITLTPNANSMGDLSLNSLTEPADVRSYPSNSRPRIIYLPHTVPTVNALLHFLYTSYLPPVTSPLATPQVLCSLLQLARPYKVDGLLEAVVERLHESLDGRNAAAIFNAAAMGAGGGDGIDLAADVPAHPPRNASLAGLPTENLHLNNGTDKNALRIDTNMANGNRSQRSASIAESAEDTDEERVPDSASTDASMASQMGGSAGGLQNNRQDEDVWNGGWSAVIGLQKRGLRGLMEGRRLRERGKAPDGASNAESSRVGLGIA